MRRAVGLPLIAREPFDPAAAIVLAEERVPGRRMVLEYHRLPLVTEGQQVGRAARLPKRWAVPARESWPCDGTRAPTGR